MAINKLPRLAENVRKTYNRGIRNFKNKQAYELREFNKKNMKSLKPIELKTPVDAQGYVDQVEYNQRRSQADVSRKAERGMRFEKKQQRALKREKYAVATQAVASRVPSQRKFRGVARGALGLISAFGVRMPAAAAYNAQQLGKGQGRTQSRPGRPSGTYKYGMPIQEYKKLQAKKKAVYRMQQEREAQQLSTRGYTPEEIRAINMRKAEMLQQGPQQPAPQTEMDFERQLAENTISPNTQAMLQRIEDIHNMGQRNDIRMQRIKREQRMVADATNIMKTPNMFKKNPSIEMDFLAEQGNILQAPNVFKETERDNIIRTKRFNIMQTREAGNDLKFF